MRFFLIFTVFFLVSCGDEKDEDLVVYDVNGDGVQDVFYEHLRDEDYELYDSNFDGKIDESYKYIEGIILTSNFDQNFDGFPETKVFYKYDLPCFSTVDADNNGIPDIYFYYSYGILEVSEKFCWECGGISKIRYEFGYPVETEVLKLDLSERDLYTSRKNNEDCGVESLGSRLLD